MITDAQFNRATLDCMTALRRGIKQEMGINIRLADSDAAETLIKLSRTSQLPELQSLGQQLSDILAPPPLSPEPAGPAPLGVIASRRLGVRIPDKAEEEPVPEAPSARVRIYRGQVVR